MDVTTLSDLELAEILDSQNALFAQTAANINLLRQEVINRKSKIPTEDISNKVPKKKK